MQSKPEHESGRSVSVHLLFRSSSRSSVSEEHLMCPSVSVCRVFPTDVANQNDRGRCCATVEALGFHCWNALLRNSGKIVGTLLRNSDLESY
jgi:hypothetical protein